MRRPAAAAANRGVPMRERPILFSAPMVRAILAGTKTQTRRVIANRSRAFSNTIMVDEGDGWWPHASDDCESHICYDGNERPIACPYGRAGDQRWVRETSRCIALSELPPKNLGRIDIEYKAGGSRSIDYALHERPRWYPSRDSNADGSPRWQPAIHMPRWASRITLKVTGVRVERLQAISEADAMAEGIYKPLGSQFWHADPSANILPGNTPQWAYRNLWESIHGHGSWGANPFVWCITFRRV